MQNHTFQYRELVYDITEILKAQVSIVFARQQRAGTLLAELVAAAGWLKIDRAW